MRTARRIASAGISAMVAAFAIPLCMSGSAHAFTNGGLVLLSTHTFDWTDPVSGGEVTITQNRYEGCIDESGAFIPHDMTFEYVVDNLSYDPEPGVTNGFSGFQILFPQAVPELYAQTSPGVGGPWDQNSHSGNFPPFGVEWDAPLPGTGIMPGETGTFNFCTFERADVVVESEGSGSGPAGWGHTWGLALPEEIIDADGIATAGIGGSVDIDVSIGDPLTSWVIPTGGVEGIDWFDNDASCTWTFGDDIHLEDDLGTCTTGIRDSLHQLGQDCKVLDLNGSLFTGQQVSVDLEGNIDFNPSGLCGAGVDPRMTFYDANGSGQYENGEDIVLDLNGDGVFGEVVNTQTFIFHGFQSVPGELLNEAGVTCSKGEEVCKKLKYLDEDRDGIIEVGEPIEFLEVIQVHNGSDETWTNVVVKDRWGAEIGVLSADASLGTPSLTTKGNSEKVFLEWAIGDLGAGETANLVLSTATDLNPAGQQEYTSCSYHVYNSGAVLKFRNGENKQISFDSGQIVLSVLTEDAQGDCDEDGFIDADDPNPHDPADPACARGGADLCIDTDGTASSGNGLPDAMDVYVGAVLASFPVSGASTAGLDWFDNDHDGLWTFGPAGDDLHSEDPGTCPTAIRDGYHDLGLDCKILDLDNGLVDQQQVDCDLEVNAAFTEPHVSNGGCPSSLNYIRYYDADGDGSWDDGEDIILDVNGDGIFN